MPASYTDLYPAPPSLYPVDALPTTGTSVQVQFTPGTWTDITPYVIGQLQVNRPVTRLQGPLWQYQAATASIVLDNSDGRFDPDNLAGPYTSSTGLQQVVWTQKSGQTGTWVAPRNLSGSTIEVECQGIGAAGFPAAGTTAGAGGASGEYARENSYTVIPGNSYVVSTTSNASFDAAGPGVIAHGASGATPGSGSTNSIHFSGAAGGIAGTGSTIGKGGGGASSPGPAAAGTPGNGGNAGGKGGIAPAGGANGGDGATDARYKGKPGNGPGAGGGGGAYVVSGSKRSRSNGGSPGGARVTLTYFITITAASVVTQVLPRVPVQVNATWAGITYNLFTGTADSWQETPVTYSAGWSEVTLTATDGFKLLQGNTIPTTSAVGSGDDSGDRISRILDFAGWSPSARQIDAGDTIQQQTTMGSDALSLLQLTADTEVGEVYINGAGNVVFRHRQGILTDPRSVNSQAVFGDNPGNIAPQISFHGDGAHSNIGVSGGPYIFYWPNAAASKQIWVWSSVAYAAGAVIEFIFSDINLVQLGTFMSTITPLTTVPQLISLSAASPAGTQFLVVYIIAQGTPAASVIFYAEAAPALDGNDVNFYPALTPWSRIDANTTLTTIANWVPSAIVSTGEIAYAAVGRANDDTTLANDIQITIVGSTNLQEATDPVSVYVYGFEKSYTRTDLLLPDDATGLLYANWVLYISKTSEDRFDTLSIDPLADTQNLYPQVLGREIGDRITVRRRPAGVAAIVSKDVFIRGIQHTADLTVGSWLTTWTLQSASRYSSFMTLDSTISGLLDSNALAYHHQRAESRRQGLFTRCHLRDRRVPHWTQ